MNQNSLSEVPLNVPSTSEIPTLATKPSSTNWLKILLFIILSLVVIAGLVFVGFYIGKKQVSESTVVTAQPEISHAPTAFPTTNPTEGWETISNNDYGISFKYPNKFNKIDYPIEDSEFRTVLVTDDYQMGTAGPLTGSTIKGTLISFSVYKLTPQDFVSNRCGYLAEGSPNLSCKYGTFEQYKTAYVKDPNTNDETFFIEKDDKYYEFHLDLSSETKDSSQEYSDYFNKIISTFEFIEL